MNKKNIWRAYCIALIAVIAIATPLLASSKPNEDVSFRDRVWGYNHTTIWNLQPRSTLLINSSICLWNATLGWVCINDWTQNVSINATMGNPFDQTLNTTDSVSFVEVVAGWFRGAFDWFIGGDSTRYLTFNGTQLDFNETALNETIDARTNVSVSGSNVTYLTNLSDVTDELNYSLYNVFYADGDNFTSGEYSHQWLSDIGVFTHTEIDAHLNNASNPHNVSTAQIGAVSLDGNETITGLKNFSFFPNLPAGFPVNDYEAANKVYVDNFASGIAWKPAVLSKTTSYHECNVTTSGERYVIPVGASDLWTGFDDNVTHCNSTDWVMEAPSVGWSLITLDLNQGWVWSGSEWALFSNPTSYTFSSGVKLIGLDIQADLLDGGGLNLSGDSIQVSIVDWAKVNKTGSLINDLGDVNATPLDGECLTWNASASAWEAGECGGSNATNWTSVAYGALYFTSTAQTAQTWTNQPLAVTELYGTVYSRHRVDSTDWTHYKLFVTQAVAGYSTAVLRLQYSADASTWSDCSGDNLGVGAGTGYKETSWIEVPTACKGNNYYRLVGEGGNAVSDPSFRIVGLQNKIIVGDTNSSNLTLVGLGDVNVTSPSDGQALVWNAVQGLWVSQDWGVIGNASNWTSVTTDTLYFTSTAETAQTWTNMPAAVTELYGHIYSRQLKDLSYATHYRLFVTQVTAGFATAVLRLQYSTDQVLWLDCSGDNLAIGAGTGVKTTGWLTLPAACRGENYLRLVGEAGDGVIDPSFRIVAVQFKTLVGDANASNLTFVGLGDVNITSPVNGEMVYWDDAQAKWRTKNIYFTNGSNTVVGEVAFVATPQTAQTWTNMPVAITELYGYSYSRQQVDLSAATEFRLKVNQVVAGAATALLRLQCSTDQILWVDCNAGNLSVGAGTGVKTSDWFEYPSAYNGDTFLRIVGQLGDAAVDPSFRSIKAEFRLATNNQSASGGNFGFNETEGIYVYNSTQFLINFNETKMNDTIDDRLTDLWTNASDQQTQINGLSGGVDSPWYNDSQMIAAKSFYGVNASWFNATNNVTSPNFFSKYMSVSDDDFHWDSVDSFVSFGPEIVMYALGGGIYLGTDGTPVVPLVDDALDLGDAVTPARFRNAVFSQNVSANNVTAAYYYDVDGSFWNASNFTGSTPGFNPVTNSSYVIYSSLPALTTFNASVFNASANVTAPVVYSYEVNGDANGFVTRLKSGNSDLSVIDTGTGKINFELDGNTYAKFNSSDSSFNPNSLYNHNFTVNGQTLPYLFRVDSSTNRVGVGTASPKDLLSVYSVTADKAIISIDDSQSASYTGTVLRNQGTEKWFIGTTGADASTDFIIRRDASTNDLIINHTTGNVGLKINPKNNTILDILPDNVNGYYSIITGGDIAGNSRTDDTAKYTRIGMPHYDNDEEPVTLLTAYAPSGSNQLRIGGGTSSGNAVTQIDLYTAADSTTVTGTSRMTILSNGKVGIGTSSPNVPLEVVGGGEVLRIMGTAAGNSYYGFIKFMDSASAIRGYSGYLSTTNDDLYTYSAGGLQFWAGAAVSAKITSPLYSNSVSGRDVYVTSAQELGYYSSSERNKKNITSLVNTSVLSFLRPVVFEFKPELVKGAVEGEKHYGLIAEEVAQVNPQLVYWSNQTDSKTGLNTTVADGVAYEELIPVLIKRVQEQDAELKELRARIEKLEQPK